MVAFGTAAWLDRFAEVAADLPEVPGASGTVQVLVSGAPDGGAEFHVSFAGGRISAAGAGVDDTADAMLTVPYALARELLDGTVDANVAYMRGDLKVAGHTGRLVSLLALAQTDAFRAAVAAIDAETDR